MKKQTQDYALGLQESYAQWERLYKFGASDPFWEDGVNLNLVRNHICYYKRMLEENPTLLGYPDVYYKELPPEVDRKYMARPDEIRVAAKVSLAKYKADKNYNYLLSHYNDFTPKTRNKLSIDNVIGYAIGLEDSIKNDELVAMRRHCTCDHYLKSFEDCVLKMQAIPSEQFQLSLFSLSSDLLTEADDNDFDEDISEEFDKPYKDKSMEM